MNIPTTLIVFFLLGILAILSVWLYSKIRNTYLRIFEVESRLIQQEKQCINLSRFACLAEARARIPNLPQDISTYSQHGEELYIWQQLGFKPSGFFIEIGAYDGVRLSNSYFFERIGWKGILIEAHPELAKQCQLNRPNSTTLHAALGETDGGSVNFSMVSGKTGIDTLSFVSTSEKQLLRIKSNGGKIRNVKVHQRSLDSLLQEFKISEVDFISIDVEGVELDILKGANLSTQKPRLLLIEDNSSGANRNVFDYLGCYGYNKIMTIGCNDFYLLNNNHR